MTARTTPLEMEPPYSQMKPQRSLGRVHSRYVCIWRLSIAWRSLNTLKLVIALYALPLSMKSSQEHVHHNLEMPYLIPDMRSPRAFSGQALL
jgi:hypothetical protein